MNSEPLTAIAVFMALTVFLFWAVAPFSLSIAALSGGGLASLILLLALFLIFFDVFVPTFGIATLIAFLLLAWGLSDLSAQQLINLPISGIWLWVILTLPGLTSVIVGVFLWRRAASHPVTTGEATLIGRHITITQWNGTNGSAMLDGETWSLQAQQATDNFIEGDTAIVSAREGLTLLITPINHTNSTH